MSAKNTYVIARRAVLALSIAACSAPPAMAAGAGALPPDEDLLRDVCSGCRVAEKKLLSDDQAGNGRVLVVVREKEGGGKEAAASPAPSEGGGEDGGYIEPPCKTKFENYAVIHYSNGRIVRSEDVLNVPSDGCSYGAAGGGESSSFDGHTLTHNIYGGSSWKWERETHWVLEPEVRVVWEQNKGYKGETLYDTTTMDEDGISKTVWSAPFCEYEADGSQKNPYELDKGTEYSYTYIPSLSTASVQAAEWRSAPFAAKCVTVEAGDSGDGYLIYGKPGDRADSRMKVVRLTGKDFLVEVADDAFVFGAPNWLNEDHLEVWEGGKLPSYMAGCLDKKKAYQWGIRLSDGKVFPAMGSPKKNPSVEMADLPDSGGMRVKRLKVSFPEPADSVSFVYSDTDDGKSVERLTGTSRVMLKDPNSLGE